MPSTPTYSLNICVDLSPKPMLWGMSQSRVMLTTSQQFQNLQGLCRVHKLHRREPLPTFKGCTHLLKVFITYTNDWELRIFFCKSNGLNGFTQLSVKAVQVLGLKSGKLWKVCEKFTHTWSNITDCFTVKLQSQHPFRNQKYCCPCFPPQLKEFNFTGSAR